MLTIGNILGPLHTDGFRIIWCSLFRLRRCCTTTKQPVACFQCGTYGFSIARGYTHLLDCRGTRSQNLCNSGLVSPNSRPSVGHDRLKGLQARDLQQWIRSAKWIQERRYANFDCVLDQFIIYSRNAQN